MNRQTLNFRLNDGETILFIGDSITDCGRRENKGALGDGYVRLFSELLTVRYPERKIFCINKGVGGNRIIDLEEKWVDDVFVNKPDWLSVQIGINDIHSYLSDPTSGISPILFEKTYDFLLRETRSRLGIPIILIEPFYVCRKALANTFRAKVLELLSEYIEVVRKMKRAYHVELVQTHELFQKHLCYRDSETFCADCIHPNHLGHLMIAKELIEILGY